MILTAKWFLSELLISTAANVFYLRFDKRKVMALMFFGLETTVAEYDIGAIASPALVV
jgi:hypothetical protein